MFGSIDWTLTYSINQFVTMSIFHSYYLTLDIFVIKFENWLAFYFRQIWDYSKGSSNMQTPCSGRASIKVVRYRIIKCYACRYFLVWCNSTNIIKAMFTPKCSALLRIDEHWNDKIYWLYMHQYLNIHSLYHTTIHI